MFKKINRFLSLNPITRGLAARISASSFLSDSLSLSIANIVASALNYSFLILAAFILPADEFGILGAAVGILTLLTMIGNVIQLQVTALVAGSGNGKSVRQFAIYYLWYTAIYLAPVVLVAILCAERLGRMINAGPMIVIMTAIAFIGLVASCIANGITSGLCKLRLQARIGIHSAITKFISALLLFWLGFGAAAGIFAYFAGYMIIFLQSFSKKLNSDTAAYNNLNASAAANTLKPGIFRLSAIYGLLIFPFVFDQILIQHFNPQIAGAYAALGIIGKLVFFLCAPVLSAVFSHASILTDTRKQLLLFRNAAALIMAVICIFLFGWLFLGSTAGQILLPSNYHHVLPEVFISSLGVSAYCLSYLVVLLAIIKQLFRVSLYLLPIPVIQLLLFSYRNETILQITQNQLITYLAQFVCLALIARTLISKSGSNNEP